MVDSSDAIGATTNMFHVGNLGAATEANDHMSKIKVLLLQLDWLQQQMMHPWVMFIQDQGYHQASATKDQKQERKRIRSNH